MLHDIFMKSNLVDLNQILTSKRHLTFFSRRISDFFDKRSIIFLKNQLSLVQNLK
jgi:hypothetical protein